MRDDFTIRVDAMAAAALAERAAALGLTVEQEIAALRQYELPLSIEEKLALSADQRAMTDRGCLSGDSTLIVRWFRDTNGGRDTDDGWSDDDRR